MALPDQLQYTSEAEYLAFERESELKHEYIDGTIVAMSGASREHNLITSSVHVALYTQLRGRGCELYQADMRVNVSATGLYTYPDIVVVCGTPELRDLKPDTLVNPTLIVETLSPSTESYDRGAKFQHYRAIESLREYVLVAQDQPRIEHYVRLNDGGWHFSDAQALDEVLELPSIGCTLALSEVYEQVDFTTAETPPPPDEAAEA